jgi:hypothetical protein
MSRLRPELLQWVGLLGGALVWTAQLVIGYGVTNARCAAGGQHFGVDLRTWELTLMGVAAALVLLAEAAAIAVFRSTRGHSHDDPPPAGRHRFFASAAVAANVLFLAIVLMSGLGAIAHDACRQS